MELIYQKTDAFGNQSGGYLRNFEADFDVSRSPEDYTNNFEVRMILPKSTEEMLWAEDTISCKIFVDGTEFGGNVTGCETDLANNQITYTGRTWRGMQDEFIIEPPAGQDYLIVSGAMSDVMAQFPMNPMMVLGSMPYTVPTYQVDRYIKTFRGVDGVMSAVNSDLMDTYVYTDASGVVTMSVGAKRDMRNDIDLSFDYGDKVGVKMRRIGDTPQHLICLGQGELAAREVIHLYAAPPNWTISQTPVAGAYPVEVYDYSSATNLLQDGIKYYQDLISNHTQIEADIYDLDVRLGDIISARDHLTGEYVEAEISKIVWRCRNYGEYQEENFEYGTKVRM